MSETTRIATFGEFVFYTVFAAAAGIVIGAYAYSIGKIPNDAANINNAVTAMCKQIEEKISTPAYYESCHRNLMNQAEQRILRVVEQYAEQDENEAAVEDDIRESPGADDEDKIQ